MLGLAKVSSCSFFVKASHYESTTRPATVFARDECQVLPKVDAVNCHESVDYRHSKRSKLDFTELCEHRMIERKLGNVINTVWKETSQIRQSSRCLLSLISSLSELLKHILHCLGKV